MKCPKCTNPMISHKHEDVEYEKCSVCEGLWLDMLELEDLTNIKGSEVIDTGNPDKGKLLNKVDKIKCPKCPGDGNLVRMVDSKQSHIWYEKCHTCHGLFLDAGEFKDLKQFTISDFIKRFFNTERK